jgi:hypothetical protein
LQERLISTGKLDAGESILRIEHMEKTGKIEKTEVRMSTESASYLPRGRRKGYAIIDPVDSARSVHSLFKSKVPLTYTTRLSVSY